MPGAAKDFDSSIATSRLILRRYRMGDARRLFELVDRNRETLRESFKKTVQALAGPKDAGPFVANRLREWRAGGLFDYGAFSKQTGRILGQITIKNIDWDIPSAELSYFLDASSRGSGFAAEMISAILRRCLDSRGFRRVFVRIIPSNRPSIRLAQRLGFEKEGLHRSEYRTGEGALVDMLYFSRIRID